jgi:hypothetical protein
VPAATSASAVLSPMRTFMVFSFRHCDRRRARPKREAPRGAAPVPALRDLCGTPAGRCRLAAPMVPQRQLFITKRFGRMRVDSAGLAGPFGGSLLPLYIALCMRPPTREG